MTSFGFAGFGRALCMLRPALAALGLAVAILAAPAATSQARADIEPFWEKSDSSAYATTKKGRKASRKSSRSYASKSSRKRSTDGGYYSAQGRSLSGGGSIRWAANSGCLDSGLRAVLSQAASYGSITVNSTCRSHAHNRSVGGAKRSKHLTGDAVDFRVHGNAGAVLAYLKSSGAVGGLKHYGGGLFHIDNGERRTW